MTEGPPEGWVVQGADPPSPQYPAALQHPAAPQYVKAGQPPLSIGGSIGLVLASILLGIPGALFSLIYAISALVKGRGSILPVVVIVLSAPLLVAHVLILPWAFLFIVFNLHELTK